MVVECEMLKESEYWKFDRRLVDQVAFPVGDRYPEEIMSNYFAIYGGMVHKFRPHRVFEIGVRYGYTAIVMCAAYLQAEVDVDQTWDYEYLGIDDESYPPSPGVTVGSCTKANDNFRIKGFHEECRAIKWNSFDGIPAKFGTFDLIHIDGNHDFNGVWTDLHNCWPILNAGGFIILDDYYFPQIKDAIHQWLALHSDTEEVLAVQFIEDERGHCLIRKTGFTVDQLSADNSIALLFDKGSYPL